MKLIKYKVLLVVLFALTLIFASTSFAVEEKNTLEKVLDEGVLKVGIMLDFPPCGYYDDNGKPAGYEVDL